MTNSPGVSIAGTVSPLPLPGTIPPLANAFPLLVGIAAVAGPLKPLKKPEVNCTALCPRRIAAKAVIRGISSRRESAIRMKAEANSKPLVVNSLKVDV
jgi:hypothetical protein